jgi:3'-5' exoribonuclease
MKLPPLRALTPESAGWGFFLCCAKEVRPGRNGDFITLTLQDNTGRVTARIFEDVDRLKTGFEAGDFVKVQGRGNLYSGRLQFIVEKIRRVNPEQDRAAGFSEEECIPSSPRPLEEMWDELQSLVAGIGDVMLAELLRRLIAAHEEKLRVWPAAMTIHHAYRGGFLEHVLKMAQVCLDLAKAYGANEDLLLAGVLLHDIGKLEELEYDRSTTYSREGRLVGHVAIGAMMVRETARGIPGFPPALLTEIEHLVLSHHGSRDFGSPVEPMTVEAFILSAVDQLDATVHQVRQAIDEDCGEGDFTPYQARLERVLYKGGRTG